MRRNGTGWPAIGQNSSKAWNSNSDGLPLSLFWIQDRKRRRKPQKFWSVDTLSPPRWHRQAMSIRGRILKQWNFSSRCLLESMLPRLSLSYHKTKKPSFADTVYEVALGSANDDKDYSKINLNAFLDVFALSLSMQLLRVNESFLICLINPTHDIRSAKNNCF